MNEQHTQTMHRWACMFLALFIGIIATNHCTAANAIYQALIEQGVRLSPAESLRLPKPAMGDGLSPSQQRDVINSLLAERYDWDTFTRRSVVTPFLLKISDGTSEAGPVGRRIDLYFVAYGSLTTLASDDYLQKQLSLAADNDGEDGGGVKLLSSEELKKRGIANRQNTDDPHWVAASSTLLGKVRIHLTTQNQMSETAESILIASIADPRFERDGEYPNSWQSIAVDDAGRRQIGPAQPYSGLGSYVKGTRLSEPNSAVFIEYHAAFIEPQGWFHGANLLRSKLPIVAQNMVRKFRRSFGT